MGPTIVCPAPAATSRASQAAITNSGKLAKARRAPMMKAMGASI